MAGESRNSLKGLYTNPNPFSEVPEGGLTRAVNVVMNRDGTLETRRGFAYATGTIAASIRALYRFGGQIVAYAASGGSGTLYRITGGAATAYAGSYAEPEALVATVRATEANQNFYFTTANGPYRLDSYTGTPVSAGVPTPLNVTLALVAGSYLANNFAVAYRVTFSFEDANKNVHISGPSMRATVINSSGGARDVTLTARIPAGITTAHTFQIWRSKQFASTIEPDDELQLVNSFHPTAPQIAAGIITTTDSQPDSLRGEALYTNPSQEGIAKANASIPKACDVAVFKNCLWVADTTSLQRLYTTLIAVPAVGQTVTIAGTTYTAAAAENVALNEFLSAGGGTVAQNIANTAQSLANVINGSASNTSVYAYYLSGYNDLPGQLLIQARTLTVAAFTQTASAGSLFSWSPSLDATNTSTNDRGNNRLYYSKPQEPEAIPLTQSLLIGDARERIQRIIPLRDSLLVFKEDGIYRVVGEAEPFSVTLLDNTASLRGRGTPAVLNNQVYCLTTQGVIAAGESAVRIVSRPIETELMEQVSNTDAFTFFYTGCAWERERKYFLTLYSLGSSLPVTGNTYVFNAVTQSWSKWSRPFFGMAVGVESGQEYLYGGVFEPNAAVTSRVTRQEQLDLTPSYDDETISVTIGGVPTTTVNIGSTAFVEAGMVLIQGAFTATILTVAGAATVTIASNPGFVAGAATVKRLIETDVQLAPFAMGAPELLKQFQSLLLVYAQNTFTSATVSLSTNLNSTPADATVALPTDATGVVEVTGFTLDMSRGHWANVRIRHKESGKYHRLAGVTLFSADAPPTRRIR